MLVAPHYNFHKQDSCQPVRRNIRQPPVEPSSGPERGQKVVLGWRSKSKPRGAWRNKRRRNLVKLLLSDVQRTMAPTIKPDHPDRKLSPSKSMVISGPVLRTSAVWIVRIVPASGRPRSAAKAAKSRVPTKRSAQPPSLSSGRAVRGRATLDSARREKAPAPSKSGNHKLSLLR